MAVAVLDGAASGEVASNSVYRLTSGVALEISGFAWSHEGCGEYGGKVDMWVEITVVRVGRGGYENALCLVYSARNGRKDGSEPFLDIYH